MGVAMMEQMYTICDTCRPCHAILSILAPVSRQNQQIRCINLTHSVPIDHSPDQAIFVSMTTTTMTTTEPITLPLRMHTG